MTTIETFKTALESAFPEYRFKPVRAGRGWVRIFVQHEGVQLGRISMEPTAGGHAVNSVKFYKKSDYEFEPRDRFFYLIHAWLDTGKVPDVDFDALVAQAKQNKAEFVASQTAWREANPIFKTEIDEDGEPHTVQKKRRRLDRSWMGEFRKLTEAAI